MGFGSFFKGPINTLNGQTQTVLAKNTGSWFDGEAVSSSNGKALNIFDRLDRTHSLTQSNTSFQASIVNSWSNNVTCLYFSRSYYRSSYPNTSDYWNFLHNGSGSWTLVAFQPTQNVGTGRWGHLWSTYRRQDVNNYTGSRGAYTLNAGTGTVDYVVTNVGAVVNKSQTTSDLALNIPVVYTAQYAENGTSIEWAIKTSTSSLGTSSYVGAASLKAPSNNNSNFGLLFGANQLSFDDPMVGNLGCFMTMKAVPTDSDLEIISNYIGSKYGLRIVPPNLSYKFRKRIILIGIGESLMVGQGLEDSYLPAGYPPTDGSLKVLNDSLQLVTLDEPTDHPGSNPIVSSLVDASNERGVGYMGMFAWRLQQQLGNDYEIIYVPCAKSGMRSWDWTSGSTKYADSLTKVSAALAYEGAVIGAIYLDQGVNDAQFGTDPSSSLGWNEKWDLNINNFRRDLNISNDVPLFYRHLCETQPENASNVEEKYTVVSASQILFQNTTTKPYKIMIESPDGPWVEAEKIHLNTQANVTMSNRLLNAWNEYPGFVY